MGYKDCRAEFESRCWWSNGRSQDFSDFPENSPSSYLILPYSSCPNFAFIPYNFWFNLFLFISFVVRKNIQADEHNSFYRVGKKLARRDIECCFWYLWIHWDHSGNVLKDIRKYSSTVSEAGKKIFINGLNGFYEYTETIPEIQWNRRKNSEK